MSPAPPESPRPGPAFPVGTANPESDGPVGGSRRRGRLALHRERCTACVICAQECPVWCITVTSHPEPVQAALPAAHGRGRGRTRNVLDIFTIDFALCMYCSICVEVCPFDALHWAPAPVPAGGRRLELLDDADTLAAHAESVPEPDPLEAGSVPSEPGRRTRR